MVALVTFASLWFLATTGVGAAAEAPETAVRADDTAIRALIGTYARSIDAAYGRTEARSRLTGARLRSTGRPKGVGGSSTFTTRAALSRGHARVLGPRAARTIKCSGRSAVRMEPQVISVFCRPRARRNA